MGEYVGMVLEESPIGIEEIQRASEAGTLISNIIKRVVTSAWRDCNPVEEPFYRVRDQLTAINGVLLLGNRYVIPEAIRHSVMRLAHEGHPGMDAFLDTLRSRVWWPGQARDATTFVERCSVCWRRHSNHAQMLQPSEIEGVWSKLAVDLVTIEGNTCLSIVDYGSRYPEVLPLASSISTAVREKLIEVFARFGLPSTLVSDNGPQFVSDEMAKFLHRLGISHVKSSPRYPQSNGMVERLHRLVRERLRGLRPTIPFSHRLQQVLMDIRNSRNRMLGTTPSEALFNRVLRTRLPTHIDPVMVNPSHQVRAKAQMAENHDSHRGVGSLPTLKPGTTVVLQDGYMNPGKRWKVVEQYGQQVGVSDGQRILLRNRRHVREYYARSQEDTWTPDTLPAQSPSDIAEATKMPSRGSASQGSTSLANSASTRTTPTNQESITAENLTQEAAADVLQPSHPSRESLFREGTVTRSGRQIKLSTKAKEADI